MMDGMGENPMSIYEDMGLFGKGKFTGAEKEKAWIKNSRLCILVICT
jgi:hypothetical protein